MNPKTPLRYATLIVGMLVLLVGAPALGAMAFDAMNAHKVDGKHAVGAGASVSKRAGKLVATDSSGHLPDDIIKRAMNSDTLDGADSSAFLKPEGLIAVPYFGPWWYSGSTALATVTQDATFTSVHAETAGAGYMSPNPPQFPSVLFNRKTKIVKVEVCYDATDPDVKLSGDLRITADSQTDPGGASGNYVYQESVDLGDATCRMFSPHESPSGSDAPQLLDATSYVNVLLPVEWTNDGGDFYIARMTYFFKLSRTEA